jgi:Phage-related minor tail protein.
MAVVNEVVTRFSFQGDLRPQREFNTGLDSSIKLLAGVAAGITAASGAMFAWANSIFNTIDPMVQLSRETGVSLESIQELGYAASVNGSSLDAVSASVREMTKRIGEFEQLGTGPAKEVVENLGISFRDANGEIKAADQVMLELTDTMAGMRASERMNVLDKLGIDPSMIQLLSLTSEEVEGLRARAQRLGVVTQEQGGAVDSYNDSLTTLRFGMQGIQNMVAVGFAPMMEDLVDRFVNLLEANQDLIMNGLNWLGEVVASTMGMLERMWPIFVAVAAGFAIAKVAAIGFGGVMSIILSPFVLWTAAILGAILIIDDLIVAFQGGKSVIADFFESFFGIDIRPALQAIVAVVEETVALMIEVFSPAVDAIGSIFKAVVAIIQGDFRRGVGSHR